MSYEKKTDWTFDDTPTENDANRWEQGIADAHHGLDEHISDKSNPHDVTSRQINTIEQLPADSPLSEYPIGVSVARADTSEGYPVNGVLTTIRSESEQRTGQTLIQSASSRSSVMYFRGHGADGWSEWEQVETTDGAQEKADAVDSRQVNTIRRDSIPASAEGTSWPQGISVMYVGNGEHSNGYPSDWGILTTFKGTGANSTVQSFQRITSNHAVYTRSWNNSRWSEWGRLATKEDVDAVDSNQVNALRGNSRTNESQPTDFPHGITNMYVNQQEVHGFPVERAHIVTFRQTTDYGSAATQTCYGTHDDTGRVWYRGSANGYFLDWVELETATGAQAKADAVNSEQVNLIPLNTKDVNDVSSSYPLGISTTYVNQAGQSWPETYGFILTQRMGTAAASQIFQNLSSTRPTIFVRTTEGGEWRGWAELETTAGAQAKADAVDSEQTTVIPNKSSDAPQSEYPRGVTTFQVSSADSGYPQSFGHVLTVNNAHSRMRQMFFAHTSEKIWTRYWYMEREWSDWVELETTAGTQAKIDSMTKADIGLGNVPNYGLATNAAAIAGTSNSALMTPLRTKAAVDGRMANENDAIAGVNTGTLMNPWVTRRVIDHLFGQGLWQPITLVNGTTNYGEVRIARVVLFGNTVSITGTVYPGLSSGEIGVLAQQFRPQHAIYYTNYASGGGQVALSIQPSGNIILERIDGSRGATINIATTYLIGGGFPSG